MGIVNFGLLDKIGTPAQIESFTRSFNRPGDLAREEQRQQRAMQEGDKNRQFTGDQAALGHQRNLETLGIKTQLGREDTQIATQEARRSAQMDILGKSALEEQKQVGRLGLAERKSQLISPFEAGQLGLRAGELGVKEAQLGINQGKLNLQQQRAQGEQQERAVRISNMALDGKNKFLEGERSLFDFNADKRKEKVAVAQAGIALIGELNGIKPERRPKWYQDNKGTVDIVFPDAPSEYNEDWHHAQGILGSEFNKSVKANQALIQDSFSEEGRERQKRILEGQLPVTEQLRALEITQENQANEGKTATNPETGEVLVFKEGKWTSMTGQEL